MILISHRGNTNGKFESYENEPMYIDKAISDGFNVEVDVWMVEGQLFLGHDKPQYGINYSWLKERKTKLWVHCKNIEALEMLDEREVYWGTIFNVLEGGLNHKIGNGVGTLSQETKDKIRTYSCRAFCKCRRSRRHF
jgi:hypothetical protein